MTLAGIYSGSLANSAALVVDYWHEFALWGSESLLGDEVVEHRIFREAICGL